MSENVAPVVQDIDHIAAALRKTSKADDAAKRVKPSHPAQGRRTWHEGTAEPLKVAYDTTRCVKVPPQTLQRHRIIAGFVRHPQEDTYRILRTMIVKKLAEVEGNALGIVSANPGDGKSLTSVNLAVSLAMVPSRTVLLVDVDLRRPRVNHYFNIDSEPGLSDYLVGKASVADCLVNPGIERLVIFPAGRRLKYSSEALASSRMTALMSGIKRRYAERLIIFDLPPLLFSDDALVLLPHVDASLLVVQDAKTKVGELQRCLDILQTHQCLGTVLNNAKEADSCQYY